MQKYNLNKNTIQCCPTQTSCRIYSMWQTLRALKVTIFIPASFRIRPRTALMCVTRLLVSRRSPSRRALTPVCRRKVLTRSSQGSTLLVTIPKRSMLSDYASFLLQYQGLSLYPNAACSVTTPPSCCSTKVNVVHKSACLNLPAVS